MTRIGIHAPYSRQEATHLGLTLATLARSLGYDVSWLSSQAHETNLHPVWDGQVQSGKQRCFKTWCRKHRCGHVLWFDVQPEKLLLAKKQGCQNTLILLWHRLREEDIAQLALFDMIVCPTISVAQAVQLRLSQRHNCQNVRCVPWDTGAEARSGRPSHDETNLFVPLDSRTAMHSGPLILHNLELLLSRRLDVTVTVGYGKTWDRPAYDALQRLQAARPQRVRSLKRRNWVEWREAQSLHHWTLLPNLLCNTGYLALDSLYCGVPVLTFDAAPFADCVQDDRNGVLIPCNLKDNWLGAPTAVFNARVLLDYMDQTLTETVRRRLIAKDWNELGDRRRQFIGFWESVWGA